LGSRMAEAKTRRRGHGEDAIYFDAAKNRYVGAVSLGFGPDGRRIRRKVSGKTKQEVRDKLRALHQELDAGIRSSAGYTVRRAVDDMRVGRADLAGQAIKAGLADEVRLFLVPVVVGGGNRALPDGIRSDLELLDTQRFASGAVCTASSQPERWGRSGRPWP
jgi:hypothetical protein